MAGLDYCKSHHSKHCSRKRNGVSGLWLIDCERNTVVRATGEPSYVALSYVWGPPSASSGTRKRPFHGLEGEPLPWPLPRTIQDAITVIKALNFRYLWVDRYCIDQTDSKQKDVQIQQMDLIYQNADLTISAAGLNDSSGLPGVGGPRQSTQKRVRFRSMGLITTVPDPYYTIRCSKWATRAWTFQEEFLSRRRLVFTEDQLYFECNAMNCVESVSSNLDILHTEDKSKFQTNMWAGIFRGDRIQMLHLSRYDIENEPTEKVFYRFQKLIEEYMARKLTYASDSLNAFSGIMRNFETFKNPIFQLWGVPFVNTRLSQNNKQYWHDFIANGLAWTHKVSCCNEDPENWPARRHDFPSWSWAGWDGAVEYLDAAAVERSFVSHIDDFSVELQSASKTYLPLLLDQEEVDYYKITRPVAIHFRAYEMPSKAFSLGQDDLLVFNHRAGCKMSVGPLTIPELFQSIKSRRWVCALLGWSRFHSFILVMEGRAGTYSRCGILVIYNHQQSGNDAFYDLNFKSVERTWFRLE